MNINYRKTTKAWKIPTQSLAYISVNGPGDGRDYALTEWMTTDPDLVIYDSISTGNERFTMVVENTGSRTLEIEKGIKLCRLTKLMENEALVLNSIQQPPEVKGAKPAWTPLRNLEARKFLEKITLKCPKEWTAEYRKLILKYHDVFSKSEYDLGWTDRVSHKIRLKHEKPINNKQFKIPLPHQEIIEEFVADMLDKKLIEVSRSRYNSPIFCVKKKNGKWRPVVDLRAINQATVEDFYSIRDIKACIDEVGRNKSKVFSAMDLSKGFFQ